MSRVEVQQGDKVLSVPASAVSAMRALGWELRGDAPAQKSQPVEPAVVAEGSEDAVTPVGAPAGNASRGEWAAFAESLGIETGDMKRDDIIAAVRAHEA